MHMIHCRVSCNSVHAERAIGASARSATDQPDRVRVVVDYGVAHAKAGRLLAAGDGAPPSAPACSASCQLPVLRHPTLRFQGRRRGAPRHRRQLTTCVRAVLARCPVARRPAGKSKIVLSGALLPSRLLLLLRHRRINAALYTSRRCSTSISTSRGGGCGGPAAGLVLRRAGRLVLLQPVGGVGDRQHRAMSDIRKFFSVMEHEEEGGSAPKRPRLTDQAQQQQQQQRGPSAAAAAAANGFDGAAWVARFNAVGANSRQLRVEVAQGTEEACRSWGYSHPTQGWVRLPKDFTLAMTRATQSYSNNHPALSTTWEPRYTAQTAIEVRATGCFPMQCLPWP
jgi:hypothetical protein